MGASRPFIRRCMVGSSRSATTRSIRRRSRHTGSAPSISWSSISIPFEATIAAGKPYAECVENIDVGGPAMIRAAAKNHADVAVVTDVSDYPALSPNWRAAAACSAAKRGDAWPRRPLPARPPTTQPSRTGSPGRSARPTTPAFRAFGGNLAQGAALRREPASVGRLLPGPGDVRPGVATRPPASGQGALLQQLQRHGRGLRMRRRVRPCPHGRRRDHQARQSLRRRGGQRPARGL